MGAKGKTLGLLLCLMILAGTVGGLAEAETSPAAFSGLWEGMFLLEGMPLPGGVLLEMENDGKGTARVGFDDEFTEQSIGVTLLEGLRIEGGGEADGMEFLLDAGFVLEDSVWRLSGGMVIDDGYDTVLAELEFYREGSRPEEKPAAFETEKAYPDAQGNSIDFSGEWAGTMLVAGISGPSAEANANLQDEVFDCSLRLDLGNPSGGTGDIFQGDNVFGPGLAANAQFDRLKLTGFLWNDTFEWYGTFEKDEETGEWTLVGGGDIKGEDVSFHIVLRLKKAAPEPEGTEFSQTPQASAESMDADLPLAEFIAGAWMREASSVISERTVHVFLADGSAVTYSARPGPEDNESTWPEGGWKMEEVSRGSWSTSEDRLAAVFENSLLSFDTNVQRQDAGTIRIEEMYTRRTYLRLPEPGK